MKMTFVWRSVFPVILALVFTGCTINVGLKKKPLDFQPSSAAPERTPIYESGGYIIARASMHNHTVFSDGCRAPEDLLAMAKDQGMAILAYTDHREDKICLGKKGLVCGKVGGVEAAGYDVYYDKLREMQAKGRDEGIIVLKGIEVIPHFWNYGKAPNLVLDGLQHHFTVYGIEDPEIFENMPVRRQMTLDPEPIPGATPWQEFVDYIVDNGGIVHAVHVEAGEDRWIGPAHGFCPPPIENLHRLKRLTGFSVLPEAWHEKTGGPGGYWDTTLIEYMAGVRERPMWAMADADYHCDGSLAISTTLMYMRELTEDEVYNCLREGRMVALAGDAFQDSYVSEWSVSGPGGPRSPLMSGEEIKLKGTPQVRFSLDRPVEGCVTRLIRNGVVVEETEGAELTFADAELAAVPMPAFYRVQVVGPVADRGYYEGDTINASLLFTNPIFVRFER